MKFLFLILIPCFLNAQTVHINGAGTTVTLNSVGEPSTVNMVVPEYYNPLTGDITFSDYHFQYSIPGYAKSVFTARSAAAYVEFRTSETSMDIKVAGDWIAATTQSDCEILVDGVYNQSVRVTISNTIQSIPITLPAGEKLVRFANGMTINPLAGSITLPNAGVYVQGVVTTGNIEIKKPVRPDYKWLFFGNSITAGSFGTHPSVTAFPALFRNDGRKVQVDAFSSRLLATTSAGLGTTAATFISDQMDGSVSNELFVFLGTNNFSNGQSKATFKTYYGHLIDAVNTLRPDIIIYCVSPLVRTTYDTPNGGGADLDDYADAISELCSTRSAWAKYIYGKDLVSLANMPADGIHPDQTGMQQLHDNLLIQYNLLNP